MANINIEEAKTAFELASKGVESILKDYSISILSYPQGNNKSTCIHELAKKGKTSILRISNKEVLKHKDIQGRTPFHWLAETKESIGLLISFPKDVLLIQDEDGKTPVHLYATHTDVSNLNLDSKYLSIQDIDGNTPIHIMVMNNVNFNMDNVPEKVLVIYNSQGDTVSHLLAYAEDKRFIRCKEALDIKNQSDLTPIDIYESKGYVTAKFRPWQRIKVIILPKKTIDVDGSVFDFSDHVGVRTYTYKFETGDILSFTLYKINEDGTRTGLKDIIMPKTLKKDDNYKIGALVKGKETELKDKLLYWLKTNGFELLKK